MPITTYILKVASRCNLNCRYCYVYNKGDATFQDQPYRMAEHTVSALLERIATYSADAHVQEINFIFHGGEPLLAGRDFFRGFVARANATLGQTFNLSYALETNATLLTKEWLDLFHELGIGFGISLDGPPAVHDAHRINHAGDGSYSRVRRAIDMVRADRQLDELFGGVLTVIDLAADPLALYHHHRDLGLRRCDFLLPDGTHDQPPPGRPSGTPDTPYADWLIAIFDEWFSNEDTTLRIRIFEDIIELLFSPGMGNDALGGGENGLLVIETDGGIEPVDVLKICGPAFTKLGLNVQRHEIRDACAVGLVKLYQQGAASLCEECRACPVVAVCGGGYLPHRYSSVGGFANPSVYCHDLMKLITHIRNRVLATVPAVTRRKLGMDTLSYEDALARAPRGARQSVAR